MEEGEVVRELASTRSIGLSAGPPAKAQEVVEILEGVARERDGYPLVFLHDNGGAYRSEEVAKWCEDHEVLQLENLPRTPQHNAAAEHGMYGLELGADLGKGRVVLDTLDACDRLAASRDRIDNYRLRRTRGWKTAVQVDQELPAWRTLVSRQEFREKAACALEEGLLHCNGRRDERRAEREAILGTLQHFSVIQRTRGGRPWTAHIAESES